jgi:uncharacterized damage-inducible protein DinB
MNSADLLTDAFGRIRGVVNDVVHGLDPDGLAFQIDHRANSIAWLVWHLTRIQDDHIADIAGSEQVWTAQRWNMRFRLPFDSSATGYGHLPEDVASVRVTSGDLLTGYHDAVHERTLSFVATLTESDLERIVDFGWDPPVTLGARLVSVISDDLQHVGQAALVRGVIRQSAKTPS